MNDAVVTAPTAATHHLGLPGVTARYTQTSAADSTNQVARKPIGGAEDQVACAACTTALGREGDELLADRPEYQSENRDRDQQGQYTGTGPPSGEPVGFGRDREARAPQTFAVERCREQQHKRLEWIHLYPGLDKCVVRRPCAHVRRDEHPQRQELLFGQPIGSEPCAAPHREQEPSRDGDPGKVGQRGGSTGDVAAGQTPPRSAENHGGVAGQSWQIYHGRRGRSPASGPDVFGEISSTGRQLPDPAGFKRSPPAHGPTGRLG